MKILVLTDSTHHSAENSVYGIVNALRNHSIVESIILVNRADQINYGFFNSESSNVFGLELNGNINYPLSYIQEDLNQVDFEKIDFCFLRLPRPIHSEFFNHLSKFIEDKRIINRPTGINKSSNKAFLLELDKYVVNMKLCKNWDDILQFSRDQACVLKPLFNYGGKGIVKIQNDQVDYENTSMSLDDFQLIYKSNPQEYLAMEFTQKVSEGDKRIVVAGGEILACSIRLPKKGDWLCNIAQGGSSHVSEPDETELAMVKYISPILEKLGIFYFGLDTLVGNDGKRFISEINTLSIGGIVPTQNITGENITGQFADLFVKHCETLK